MSRGQTPRPRHDGPLLTGGGLAQPKRRGGCRVDSCGHAATGEPPGIDEASEPWRVALQAGPGALTPWPCGRTATLASAARRNRARGHCRIPTRRSRRLGRQRKASQGTLAALAAAPPVSHSEGRIAHQHLATPRPPRGRASGPGARSIASRPGEPAARTPLWRDPSPDVRGPVVHQHPAPIEQVAAPVGRFHAIAVDVRKRQLAHLARRVGALRRPVPEA